MPALQQSIVAIPFFLPDPPASVVDAVAPMQPIPDTVDLTGFLMPVDGAIVAIAVAGAPVVADTMTFTPQVRASPNGAAIGNVANLAVTITNAAPNASAITTKDDPAAQVKAGQGIALLYHTTTTGVYTLRDVAVILFVSTGRTDI